MQHLPQAAQTGSSEAVSRLIPVIVLLRASPGVRLREKSPLYDPPVFAYLITRIDR